MATDRMELSEWLRKVADGADVEFLREGVRMLAQALMELEVSERTGAAWGERSPERVTHRNGYRSRAWETQVGALELRIPKLREGSYLPSLLEPRRRIDRAMAAVIQEAYVHGVSTRKVDEIVRALGMTGVSAQSVSRLCAELDGQVEAFLTRPLERRYPYLWLDATYLKVRSDHRVLSQACVIAIGITESGEREILGLELGPSEEAAFWGAFLRRLVERGLSGVELVVSDAHQGLKGAIEQVLTGACWQRCRVHFMRNLLALVPRHAGQVVAAAVRTVFAQPDKESAHQQLERVAEGLKARFPQAAQLLLEAEEEILAHMAFPPEHRAKLHSTNPLERINGEIKRRTRVVGIFPNRAAALRLVGAILMEQQDEWAVGRRYLSAESMAKLNDWKEGERPAELLVAVA